MLKGKIKIPAVKNPSPTLAPSDFDTALPESLLHKTSEAVFKPRISRHSASKASPYIIRLSRENSTPAATENIASESENEVAALLEHLMNQSEEETTTSEPALIDFTHILEQAQEDIVTAPKLTMQNFTPSAKHAVAIALPLAESHPQIQEKIENIIQEPEIEPTLEIIDEVTADDEEEELAAPIHAKTWSLKFGPVRYRMTAAFIALSLLFVIPIQAMQEFAALPSVTDQVISQGKSATDQISAATSSLGKADFAFAANDFASASQTFTALQSTITSTTSGLGLIAKFLPGTSDALRTGNNLIAAGQSLSEGARILALGAADIDAQKTMAPAEKLHLMLTYLDKMAPNLQAANEAIKKVDPSIIPESQRPAIEKLVTDVPAMIGALQQLQQNGDALYQILGGPTGRKYLVVFQNSSEMRPTGGFIGSYAEVTIDKGLITDIHVPKGGSYDIEGQQQLFLSPPEPLALTNPRWEFQDANWFPDFRLSSKKLLDFYEAAGQPTVDGVIAVNSDVLPKLLAVTGPITLSTGKQYDSENILFEIEKDIEVDARNNPTTVKQPKAIMGELVAALFEKLKGADAQTLLAISDSTLNSLATKDIQISFTDNALATLAHKLRWDGAQETPRFDNLQIVDTNITGGKSDSVMSTDNTLDVNIAADGTVTNTLTIQKTHKGLANTLFTGVTNVDYIRAYVPNGSKLISTEGFTNRPDNSLFATLDIPLKIDADLELNTQNYQQAPDSLTDSWNENGFTVFGNWIQTRPGETQTVKITYELPKKVYTPDNAPGFILSAKDKLGINDLATYSLQILKQSGVTDRQTKINLHYPSTWQNIWSTMPESTVNNDFDHTFSSLFSR